MAPYLNLKRSAIFGALAIGFCVAGNATATDPVSANFIASTENIQESDRLAAEAIKLIQENQLDKASLKISDALRLQINKSYYHLINGLIYHLQARRGTRTSFELAEQGYQLSMQFDGSNWQAYYYSGLLALDMAKFDLATKRLSEALLYRSDDPSILRAMAYAAYRAGKPDIAAGAMDALAKHQGKMTETDFRNGALIMAAAGEPEKAGDFRRRLETVGEFKTIDLVDRRIKDWSSIYNGMQKTQFAQPAGMPGAAVPPPTAPGTENKMVVVDVVMIATEENISTAKGVNLLSGLQVQYGSANGPGWQALKAADGTSSITRALTIPAISYTMNILNAGNTRTEILARPTLIAKAGKASKFFSGEELTAVAVSTGAAGGAPVNIQKEIGVSLAVTPTFIADGRVSLDIVAERTFIKTPSTDVSFTFKLETTKSKVEANVVMRTGETLILGGLSEKEADTNRDGIPLLQDIPIVQYLSSRSTTMDYQKSVLILITPRPAQYVYQPENARQEYEKSLSEDERSEASLRSRYSDWFKPYPNWASVFHHLQENGLYREFRTGDVTLENWTDMRTLKDRLNHIYEFLYY